MLKTNKIILNFIIALFIVFIIFSIDLILLKLGVDNLTILVKVLIEEFSKFVVVFIFFMKIFNDKKNFLWIGLFFSLIEFFLYFFIFYGYGINFVLIRYFVVIIHILTFIILYYSIFFLKLKKSYMNAILLFLSNVLIHYLWNYFSHYIS